MPSVSQITALSDQAIAWVVLLHSGAATEQDRKLMEEWQNRTSAHQKAFIEAEQLWLEMAAVEQCLPEFSTQLSKFPNIKPVRFKKSRLAGMALCLLALTLLNPVQYVSDRWLSDYHTGIGEQKSFTLSDGSTVILNTNTAISLDWTASRRRIKLLHGQAQFTVAPNLQRPFEVATDDAVVKALGTIFEVLNAEQGTRVTVLEHAVSIKSPTDREYNNENQIQTGQQVRFSQQKGLESIQVIDLKQNSAWQRGKLIVKNQPLAEVVADLNRYYSGKIILTNQQLSNLHVTGVFPLRNPVAVLSMLEQSLPLKVGRVTPWLTLIFNG